MKRIWVILAILLLIPLHAADAQDSIRIKSVSVEIWPEFDRPAVLVIYHILLADETPLPTQVDIQVPARAEITAVAQDVPWVGLILTDYSQKGTDEFITLSISTTTNSIQMEYYDVLEKDGALREILFTWPGNGSVDSFRVIFQNPVGAVNVTLVPEPVSSQLAQYNLIYYFTETFSLKAGEEFSVKVTYEKGDNELSITSLPVESFLPLGETHGQVYWNSILPWILGSLGVILFVVGLLVLFGFRGFSRKGKLVRLHQYPSRISVNKYKETSVHCKECGQQAETDDKFCRSCGTRL
jgi:hypothetical protein